MFKRYSDTALTLLIEDTFRVSPKIHRPNYIFSTLPVVKTNVSLFTEWLYENGYYTTDKHRKAPNLYPPFALKRTRKNSAPTAIGLIFRGRSHTIPFHILVDNSFAFIDLTNKPKVSLSLDIGKITGIEIF